MFKAWVLSRDAQGFHAQLQQLDEAALPDGDVLVQVAYSSINYKDALALTDSGPVVRTWPMVPGIDGAGVVLESSHPDWKPGDRWLLNGWGVGETHWGCLAEKARLRGDWLIPIPPAFDARAAMVIGTAGYTAMLCVLALERHGVQPGDGEVLVTGASGGVGSVALALLHGRGYRAVALTGKPELADALRQLGAADVLARAPFETAGKPLQKERWAAVIDTCGSHILANACAQTRRNGIVAACGLAQGMDLPTTVAPFILRSVTLAGVDSVMQPLPVRRQAWAALAAELDAGELGAIGHDIALDAVQQTARDIVAGRFHGRAVVRI